MVMDPRSGDNGRGVVGIKNGYLVGLQEEVLCFGPCSCEQQQALHLIRLWGTLSWDVRSVGGSSCWATSSGSRHGSSSCSNCFCVAPPYLQIWHQGHLEEAKVYIHGVLPTEEEASSSSSQVGVGFWLSLSFRLAIASSSTTTARIHSILLLPFEMQSHAFDRFRFTRRGKLRILTGNNFSPSNPSAHDSNSNFVSFFKEHLKD